MDRRVSAFGALMLGLGACSLINSTEDLKPVDGDPSGGDGPVGTAGKSNDTAGKGNSGGADGNEAGANNPQAGAGAVAAGGCSQDCGEGGAPPIGRECTVSADDCGSTAPICDATAGECRACAKDQECASELDLAFCVKTGAGAGRCAECKANSDCSGRTPVCGPLGVCRACGAAADCDSGVCDANGACAAPETTVYALAETGVSNKPCGTLDMPCRNLSDAASQLTAQRHNLVLVKTTKKFIDGFTLPALKGIRVVGNGVVIAPYTGASAVIVPAGAGVAFEDMSISNSTAQEAGGIVCTNASIKVSRSTLQDNASGVLATDCDVTVEDSRIVHNSPDAAYNASGLRVTCTTAHCPNVTSFVRNRFVDNGVALYVSQQAVVEIVNNLFLRNGFDNYTRVIQLNADTNNFGYNTLVENFNNGIYIGIVACGGTCNNVGNISFNNFPGHPEYGDQVWYGGTLTYNLTEVTYPGVTNKSGDPLFVDAANGDFTPGPRSPALDNGNPNDFPKVDLLGNKRPGGAAPDMGAFEAR